MKKQIEEMADEVRRIRESYFGQADYLFAMKLYEAGYRKQSDVTDINVGSKSEWISVEERLPEEKVMVLGYVLTDFCDGGTASNMYVMELKYGSFYPFNCSKIKGNSKVTHWMPLPEPPKMKGGEG